MNIIQIGCGGIGGWAAQCLAKMSKEGDLHILIDGDIIEKRNLDRQLFREEDIGNKKARALGGNLVGKGRYSQLPHYLGSQEYYALIEANPFPDYSTILVGVDNHPARRMALELCDDLLGDCIIAANEYEDAEAYYYRATWKGTEFDPRIYYPEIITDLSDNPLAPPCTGEILESAPQLAVANMNAASLMMWLFWYWKNNAPKLTDPDAISRRILGIRSNAFGWEIIRQMDKGEKS